MARYEFIAVYIVASQRNGTPYIGVTSDLQRRAYEHREGLIDGFTKKYGCKLLVWFERHEQMHTALAREKELKLFRRAWKLELIEKTNPQWRDLHEDFVNPRQISQARGSPREHPGSK